MFDLTGNDEVPEICLLTAADVARRLSISLRYAYHLIKTGQIANVQIGRAVRVLPRDLDAFIDSLPRSCGKDA